MSQTFTASDGAVITYTPPPAPTPTPTPAPGALVPASGVAVGALTFNDDFSGSSLDATKWSDTLAWGMNNTTLNPGNVSVANSVVTLTLSSPTVGAGIHTAGKWAQSWGYYEWRVWGPSTDWWAAWMTGVGAGSPA